LRDHARRNDVFQRFSRRQCLRRSRWKSKLRCFHIVYHPIRMGTRQRIRQ
jgi:hypothetical protein